MEKQREEFAQAALECSNFSALCREFGIDRNAGYKWKNATRKRKPFQRFEKKHCNQMWQADFKGEFRMADGNYCFPLDILDDHSKFAIRIVPDLTTANVVIPTFLSAFREFGLPDSVLSDNGAQFAGFKKGYTRFERWLMDLDVLPFHGRIKHPQTQGKIERFHRTMKQKLLNHTAIANLADAREKLSA